MSLELELETQDCIALCTGNGCIHKPIIQQYYTHKHQACKSASWEDKCFSLNIPRLNQMRFQDAAKWDFTPYC